MTTFRLKWWEEGSFLSRLNDEGRRGERKRDMAKIKAENEKETRRVEKLYSTI
jgi:hypothetical protein